MVTELNGKAVDLSTNDGYSRSLFHALPTSENGRLLRPFQIVSLLEMIEFEAGEFFGLLNRLISVRKDLEDRQNPLLTESEQASMIIHAGMADHVCAKYDIDVTYYTERLRRKVNSPDAYTYSVASAVDAVKHRVIEELRNRKFMYMRSEDAEYYDHAALFGDDVNASFPDAELDIRSVGNGIACELFSASVFHSMRVAEFGLRRIAAKLKVRLTDRGKPIPIEYATWDKVITACKNKITKIRTRPVGPKKQSELEFYSDAADHCLFMKDIWRNNISHTRQPYKESEAIAVLERVKDFMKFLTVNVP